MAPKPQKKDEGSKFVRYFGPLLSALRGLGGSGAPDEVAERIVADLSIPDEIQNELLPSGQSRYYNQVAWARFYLVKEGLLDSSKRGVWSLTEKGRVTTLTPEQSREIFLKWVRIFQEQRRSKSETVEPAVEQVAGQNEAPPNDYRAAHELSHPLIFSRAISNSYPSPPRRRGSMVPPEHCGRHGFPLSRE